MRDRIGFIGSGMLGSAILRAWIDSGTVAPEALIVANRSGTLPDVPQARAITVTTDPASLAARCGTIVLCVPPAAAPALGLHAPDALILSVMAAATLDDLTRLTGAARVLRAMSNPAAAHGMAYSPFVAAPPATRADLALARRLLGACGPCDQLADEALLDHFTAMTGPVPGFVAAFAEAMVAHAVRVGTPPEIADRAIRQLFLSAGHMLAKDAPTAAEHVQGMIDYAGTTAAGLERLRRSTLHHDVSEALTAAAEQARRMRPA